MFRRKYGFVDGNFSINFIQFDSPNILYIHIYKELVFASKYEDKKDRETLVTNCCVY